eukprot:Rmarinus@m.1464
MSKRNRESVYIISKKKEELEKRMVDLEEEIEKLRMQLADDVTAESHKRPYVLVDDGSSPEANDCPLLVYDGEELLRGFGGAHPDMVADNGLVVCRRFPSSIARYPYRCEEFVRPMLTAASPVGMWAVWRYNELTKNPSSLSDDDRLIYTKTADSIRRIFNLSSAEVERTCRSISEMERTCLIATALDRLYSRLGKQFRVSTRYPLLAGRDNPCYVDYLFYRLEPIGDSSSYVAPFGVGEGMTGRESDLEEVARLGALTVTRCFRGSFMMGFYHDASALRIDLHAALVDDEDKHGYKRVHSGEVARVEVASRDLVAFLRVHVELLEILSSPINDDGPQARSAQLLNPGLLESGPGWLKHFFPHGGSNITLFGSKPLPMIRVYCANGRLHKLFAVRGVPAENVVPRPVHRTLQENMARLVDTMNDVHDNSLDASYFMIDDHTAILSARFVESERSRNPSAGHFYSVYQTLVKLRQNGMVHGDVHRGNIVFAREKGYLVDFDMLGVAGETTYISRYNSMGRLHRKLQGVPMKTLDDAKGLAFVMRQFTPTEDDDHHKADKWIDICISLGKSGFWPDADQDVAFELRELKPY